MQSAEFIGFQMYIRGANNQSFLSGRRDFKQ